MRGFYPADAKGQYDMQASGCCGFCVFFCGWKFGNFVVFKRGAVGMVGVHYGCILLMDDIKSVDMENISFFHGIRLVSYPIMFHGMSTGMGGIKPFSGSYLKLY